MLVIVLVTAAACRDLAANIEFRNDSGVPIMVHPNSEGDSLALAPGELGVVSGIPWPADTSDTRLGRLRFWATDVAGQVLYCHRFTYDELSKANLHVNIVRLVDSNCVSGASSSPTR